MTARSAAAGSAVDAARLGDALARVNRALRREVALPTGASTLQALGTLNDIGRMRLGDLARHEGITPATLSRVVAVLEEHGYAERVTDPDDRRSAFLEVTDAGRRVIAQVRSDRGRVLAERVDRLDADARRRLADALDALESLAQD